MLWPKRDSIYSFLRHFGPFGSITTAIFSENPGCSNLAKTRFLKKEYSHASTDHQVQFSIVSSIFQRPWHTQGLWKIPKSAKNCTGWAVETLRELRNFFRNWDIFFQKITKSTKKKLSHEKIKKLLPGTYILIYVLWNQ